MPMDDQQLTENKLILLYVLQQKETISSIELSDYIIFKGYMDYFSMQQLLAELEESELVMKGPNDQYRLSSAGREVVETFRSRIPNSIRDEITEYARTSAFRRSSMLEADTTIQPVEKGYQVRLGIRDYDHDVLALTLSADTEEEAFAIRNRWQKSGMTIYRHLISELKG